ncbi:hypothetical protein Stok01_02784 [Sulfurisphaera tokodaii]
MRLEINEVNKLTLHYTISRYLDAANIIPYSLYTKEDASVDNNIFNLI